MARNIDSNMQMYDTMARKVVKLDLPADRVIKVFVCGPTVQDNFHIGHARTYIFFDALVKYLRASGLDVFYLQNITDVDDKIINRAREDGVDFSVISGRYTAEFLDLMGILGIDSVNFHAFATRHLQEIIAQIGRLVETGFAYETSDGVYFSVAAFADFGKLSGQDLEALKPGSRVTSSEEKKDPRDFVIWKKMKPGEPCWDSPWGKGRPGWHVEDTAITEKYFGATYDIHGGGTDLIFPHHEAEIAIERSISGEDHLSRYWIHSGMVNVNEEKMSKSLKNYVTIRSVLQDFEPEELRFALLNAQFRTSVNFSQELLQEARANVNAISLLYRKLRLGAGEPGNKGPDSDEVAEFRKLLDNNFDLRTMFRELLIKVGEWNTGLEGMGPGERNRALRTIEWVNSFTGILKKESEGGEIQGVVDFVLEIRKRLREKKDFSTSDEIRAGLRELGIYIEDKGGKTIWWNS